MKKDTTTYNNEYGQLLMARNCGEGGSHLATHPRRAPDLRKRTNHRPRLEDNATMLMTPNGLF